LATAAPAIIIVGAEIGAAPITQGLTVRARANAFQASLSYNTGIAAVSAVIHVCGGIYTAFVAA
jgi:hypothetical protein